MRIPVLVPFVLCAFVDLSFSYLLYPALSTQFLALDGDGFGVLASTLLECGRFAFDCTQTATVFRGPAYPAALALVNLPWGEIDPARVAIFHTLLNLLLLAAIIRLAHTISDRRTAIVAGLLFSIHPLAHVFVPRFLADTMLATLFIGGITMMLAPPGGDTRKGDALAAATLTIALLVKQIMLPMVPIVALLVRHQRRDRSSRRSAALVAFVPLLLILPWSLRTSTLAGSFVPIHTGSGFNVVVGNDVAGHFLEHPFAGLTLFQIGQERAELLAGPERHDDPVHDAVWDGRLLRNGIGEWGADPVAFVWKLSLNVLLFFTLGTSVSNSLVMLTSFLLLLPFVLRGLRRTWRLPMGGALMLIGSAYMALHLPVYAIGRFSIPILPIFLLIAAMGIRGEDRSPTPS